MWICGFLCQYMIKRDFMEDVLNATMSLNFPRLPRLCTPKSVNKYVSMCMKELKVKNWTLCLPV